MFRLSFEAVRGRVEEHVDQVIDESVHPASSLGRWDVHGHTSGSDNGETCWEAQWFGRQGLRWASALGWVPLVALTYLVCQVSDQVLRNMHQVGGLGEPAKGESQREESRGGSVDRDGLGSC